MPRDDQTPAGVSEGYARPSDFLPLLPFVQTYRVRILEETAGHIVIEAPFQEPH